MGNNVPLGRMERNARADGLSGRDFPMESTACSSPAKTTCSDSDTPNRGDMSGVAVFRHGLDYLN